MSHRRFLDHDPLTGVTEYFHYDSITDTSAIETVQDCSDILDRNKSDQNNESLWKDGVKDSLAPYATIPIVVQVQWLNEYGLKDWPMLPQNKKLLLRLLASREWGYLRRTSKIHI